MSNFIFKICLQFVFILNITAQIESNSNGRFQLERSPESLTCTLYIKLNSLNDLSIWNEVILDNKEHFILCLTSHGNPSVPPPTISFLEQCSLNIIVAEYFIPTYTEPSDIDLYQNIHRARSRLHSSFLIILNNCESYFHCSRIFSSQSTLFRTRIFYHYISCKYNPHAGLFPNAFMDFLDNFYGRCRINWITKLSSYSIFTYEAPVVWLCHIAQELRIMKCT